MSRFATAASLAAILLTLAVPGCSRTADAPAAGDPGADRPSPAGVWRWTRLNGSKPFDVSKPGNYTLELLAEGRYAVRADCNQADGAYERSGGELSLQPGPMTLATCPPGSLSSRFVNLLSDVTSYEREGNRLVLHLADGIGSMEFAAGRDVALAGSAWLVRSYNNGRRTVATVAEGTTIHASFGEDGSLRGSTGCNSYTSSYELDGNTIAIGPAATTRKMCPDEIMQQEADFLAALSSAATWEIRGGRLQLHAAAGTPAVGLASAVSGTLAYQAEGGLPPNAMVTVQLQNLSRADVATTVVGQQLFPAAGRQAPLSFVVSFDPADIDAHDPYGLQATIRAGDELLFTSQAVPVITRDSPSFGVEVKLDPAG